VSEASEKFRENLLRVAAPIAVTAGIPIIGGLLFYIGTQWIEETRAMRADLQTFIIDVRGEFKASDTRMDNIDIRLTGAERDIKYLQGRE
jgi:hypothetical protein